MAQVAVITGGAKRIGSVVARHLHAVGFDIALHYRHSQHSARLLAQDLNDLRASSCELFQADLGSSHEIAQMSDAIRARFDVVDVLVNNASGFEPTPIADCSVEQFDAMLSSNLRGPYFLIQGLLPLLSKGASIVNILDVHVDRPLPQFNVYGAAKAGLASLTRSLAVELAPGVRVNGIAPGAILWPEKDAAYDATERDRTLAATPLQRLGDPMDIARTVAFLALEAPFITGQIITVDGGRGLTVQGSGD